MLVCGSRQFHDRILLWRALDRLRLVIKPRLLITGGAPGVDSIAHAWGLHNGLPSCEMKAAWKAYGKRAGSLRNGWMIEFLAPDIVVGFPGGPGTQDMLRRARDCGIEVMMAGYDHAQDD